MPSLTMMNNEWTPTSWTEAPKLGACSTTSSIVFGRRHRKLKMNCLARWRQSTRRGKEEKANVKRMIGYYHAPATTVLLLPSLKSTIVSGIICAAYFLNIY